jgi:bifunctional non-homologous end joining protein LigD
LTRDVRRLVDRLDGIERDGGDGTLTMPDGFELMVSGLNAAVWPKLGITKGELLRYYVRVAALLLPNVADRPLGARYFPSGVGHTAYFQQRAPARVPPGVRVEVLNIDIPVRRRLVGGSLLTLLYMTDAGAVSQDPWFSRVASLDDPDYAVFDLDPMPGASFGMVRDVARWIGEALERVKVVGVPKTSGASGLHIYVPLAPRTSYDDSRVFCETIARHVAGRHRRVATTERTVAARGPRVYIDCLQNLRSKTLATAYSARASAYAGVSMPVTWKEVDGSLDPRAFTVRSALDRIDSVGDLWSPMRRRGLDLATLLAPAAA